MSLALRPRLKDLARGGDVKRISGCSMTEAGRDRVLAEVEAIYRGEAARSRLPKTPNFRPANAPRQRGT